jgi:hypothetical protein
MNEGVEHAYYFTEKRLNVCITECFHNRELLGDI